jgi:hypothetical protein
MVKRLRRLFYDKLIKLIHAWSRKVHSKSDVFCREKLTGVGSKIIICKIQYDHHLATRLTLTFLSLLYWESVEKSLPMQHKSVQWSESFWGFQIHCLHSTKLPSVSLVSRATLLLLSKLGKSLLSTSDYHGLSLWDELFSLLEGPKFHPNSCH